jgi:uncharacterized membrane protein YgaE (UPF0421/DUF939 family)
LLDFIKLVVGKIDRTSTTESENIITKISPKKYKQQTEQYWKVLQCHNTHLKYLLIHLSNAKSLKMTVNDNNNLFDTILTSIQTMKTYNEIAERIMRLNESLNPSPIKVTPHERLFEEQDEDYDERGSIYFFQSNR